MGKSLIHASAVGAVPMLLVRPVKCPNLGTRQQGVILFFTLIALVVMTLAAIALVRSVDTSISIAGNAAFKQATIQASDTGIEIAVAALPGIGKGADIANQYFALEQPVDALGVPTTINWATVPCRTTAGVISDCTDSSAYRIQYVIDRLCGGTLPVTDVKLNCVSQDPKDNGSKKANSPVFSTGTKIYYRATVKVLGPRDTTSIIQGTLGY